MKIYNITEVLRTLVHYYDFTRQVGHTTTMMEGAEDTNSTILVHNQRMGEHIKHMFPFAKNNFVSTDNLKALLQSKKPLALDNCAIHMILLNALNRITELEAEVKEYSKVKTFINKTITPKKKKKK